MRNLSYALALTAIMAVGLPLKAQTACTGPGAAFGVVSYQCSECTMQQRAGTRPISQFRAEPIILKTEAGSPLQSGDIIEAVNGQPITTAAGAEQFTYPTSGVSEITVRRDGHRTTVQARTSATCTSSASTTTSSSTFPAMAGSGAAKRRGRFGFAIACTGCTRKVGPDGSGHWTFESSPTIGDLDPDGPAAKSGIHVGDVIVEANGQPVLQEVGALALARAEQAPSLRLTIRRADGTVLTVTLQAWEK